MFLVPQIVSAEVSLPKSEEEAFARVAVSRAKESNIASDKFLALLWCESGLKPKALNLNKNGTRDVGIAQINDIHLPILKQMNLSRFDPYDSINYALYLIQTDGWRHYSASKKCWSSPKTMKKIATLMDS